MKRLYDYSENKSVFPEPRSRRIIEPALHLPSKPAMTASRWERPLLIDDLPPRASSFTYPQYSPIQPVHPVHPVQPAQTRRTSKHRRKRRWLVAMSLILILSIVIGIGQASGQGGAILADVLRATLGPTTTARIESWYLGITDTAHQVTYHLQGQQAKAPWLIPTAAPVTPVPTSPAFSPMPLTSLSPLITPAIPGEGTWVVQAQSTPTATLSAQPIIAKMFLRPDPNRPYAIVTLLQFDTRFTQLHMIAGTTEPGGPLGVGGPGVIPKTDLQSLLAAFNGGFKYADGQYGMTVNGITYVPSKPGVATIAVTKEGQIILGKWGADARLSSTNTDLVAWRQNAALLIDQGVINPLTSDGAAWGGTILNSTYTWRSGLGITPNGSLVYAAGDSLSAQTLGVALQKAGAVMAMQTDINPFWVRAFLYQHAQQGTLNITKLNPSMYGTGYEYLYSTQRDFFYMTYRTPTLSSQRNKIRP